MLTVCRMEIFGFIMLTGAISTWFIPETKGKRLEELCGEEDASENEGDRKRYVLWLRIVLSTCASHGYSTRSRRRRASGC